MYARCAFGDVKAKGCRLDIINCVADDALYVLVVIGRAGFVSGLEVEDFSHTAVEYHAAAHDIAVLKPAAEDQLVRLHGKRFGIKLLALKTKMIGNACGNRVRGIEIPDDLLLLTSPREITR